MNWCDGIKERKKKRTYLNYPGEHVPSVKRKAILASEARALRDQQVARGYPLFARFGLWQRRSVIVLRFPRSGHWARARGILGVVKEEVIELARLVQHTTLQKRTEMHARPPRRDARTPHHHVPLVEKGGGFFCGCFRGSEPVCDARRFLSAFFCGHELSASLR